MLNHTFLFETDVVESRQKIAKIRIHNLKGIPIPPPPYRDLPNKEAALLLEIETNDGVKGYSTRRAASLLGKSR
jgi:hypothetical protein